LIIKNLICWLSKYIKILRKKLFLAKVILISKIFQIFLKFQRFYRFWRVNVNIFHYSFLDVLDLSALQPLTVPGRACMSVSWVFSTVSYIFKKRKAQRRPWTLDSLKRLQNHVHASKAKETLMSFLILIKKSIKIL
jgi:hypothetical protein